MQCLASFHLRLSRGPSCFPGRRHLEVHTDRFENERDANSRRRDIAVPGIILERSRSKGGQKFVLISGFIPALIGTNFCPPFDHFSNLIVEIFSN